MKIPVLKPLRNELASTYKMSGPGVMVINKEAATK